MRPLSQARLAKALALTAFELIGSFARVRVLLIGLDSLRLSRAEPGRSGHFCLPCFLIGSTGSLVLDVATARAGVAGALRRVGAAAEWALRARAETRGGGQAL